MQAVTDPTVLPTVRGLFKASTIRPAAREAPSGPYIFGFRIGGRLVRARTSPSAAATASISSVAK